MGRPRETCEHGVVGRRQCGECQRAYHRSYAKTKRRPFCAQGHVLTGRRERGDHCPTCKAERAALKSAKTPRQKPFVHPLGKRFGRLILLARLGNGVWSLQCDCGTVCQKNRRNVTHGRTQSCGKCGLVRRGPPAHKPKT